MSRPSPSSATAMPVDHTTTFSRTAVTGRERLGGAFLGDDRPAQSQHRQRRVRAQHRALGVVRVHAEAGSTFFEYVLRGLRLDGDETDARALGLHGIRQALGVTRFGHALGVGIDVFHREARDGSRRAVGRRYQVGFAGVAEAAFFPLAFVRHHRVDLVDGHLHDEHADLLAAVENRRAEEGGLVVVRRQVFTELGQRDHAGLVERPRRAEGVAEFRLGERTAHQRGREVELLEHRVNDGAVARLDQEDVVQAELLERGAQVRMERAVQFAVARAVVGAFEVVLAAERMRVRGDVLVLQVHREVGQAGRGVRHVDHLAGVAALELGHEIGGVVLGEARALGGQVGDVEYRVVIRGRQLAHGVHDVRRGGEHLHLVRQRIEIVGDLRGLRCALGDQRFAGLRLECGAAGVQRFATYDDRRDSDRDDGEEQRTEQKFLAD